MKYPTHPLGEIVDFVGGSQPPKSTFRETPHPDFIRLIQIRDFKSDRFKAYIPKSAAKREFQTNDIMIARYGPPVFQILRGLSGSYNVALMKAQPKIKHITRDYIFYLLQQPFVHDVVVLNSQRTAGQTGVNLKLLNKIEVPLPPLETQKKIALVLDKANRIRQKRKQALKRLDDLIQSVFLDMFGDPVTNPMGWEKVDVGQVTDCIVPGRDKPKSFTGTIPWVTTEDLTHLSFTSISRSGKALSKDEVSAVKAKVIPKNSILLVCAGLLGTVSLSTQEMVVNQQIHTFQTSKKLVPSFLMFCLSFQKNFMQGASSSTTISYMNKTRCNSIPVLLPPTQLQQRFAEAFKKLTAQKQKIIENVAYFDNLFNSLLQKAFKGELNFNHDYIEKFLESES